MIAPEDVVELFCCVECKSNLHCTGGRLTCRFCGADYPIIDGIPRFVPQSFWKLDEDNSRLAEKTKNYFGFEWDHFRDWGFIRDEDVDQNDTRYSGGLVSHRKSAFDSKCRLTEEDLKDGKVILDAGCGNGRYTYEAALRANAGIVVGVDIGYGSVLAARDNTRDLHNVLIIQADLFKLPIRDCVIDSCFCNGVLMHTSPPRDFVPRPQPKGLWKRRRS